MIFLALVLAAVGLAASALFSGSETGFYRATRLRLVLDAMGGSRYRAGPVLDGQSSLAVRGHGAGGYEPGQLLPYRWRWSR